jgi:uncharacterized protein with von Willebrand factor type A (vWA) domain
LADTLEDVEREINLFCFAVDSVTKYLNQVIKSNDLDNVDISMWTGIDTDFTNIDRMVERAAVSYVSWEHFIDSIADVDLPDEYKDKLVQIMQTCKEFEEANPHIVIQEVVDSLLALVDETAEKPEPKDYEIN